RDKLVTGVQTCALPILRAAAELAAECQPILPRQHQIEHQQIHVRALHDATHFPSVGDGGGAEIVLLEILGQQAADLAIVVDDERSEERRVGKEWSSRWG